MESFKDRKNKNQVVQKNIKTKKAKDNYFNYECNTIYSSIYTKRGEDDGNKHCNLTLSYYTFTFHFIFIPNKMTII